MKQTARFAIVMLAVGLWVGVAHAQTKTTVGAVTKIAADVLTVDAGKDGIVELVTNDKTTVKVTGGSTKAQAAARAGEKGVKITELVHEGDQVQVKYTEAGGKKVASSIDVLQRRPASTRPPK
jgi:hypothetical protein